MKFSIITASYNASQTIADTVRSVRVQRGVDFEHLIIDGASPDGTAEIARRSGDEKLTVMSAPDHGMYDAMNKGIAAATGDIIGILNADDFFADDHALQSVAAVFAEDEHLEAVLGDVAFIDERGAQTRRYRSGTFRPSRLRWGWMPAHPGMYLTREVYARVGPYRTDLQIAADFDFAVRAFAHAGTRYRHLDRVLVNMRPGGASTRNLNARVTINREVVRACRDNGIYSNLAMVMSKYPLKMLEHLR